MLETRLELKSIFCDISWLELCAQSASELQEQRFIRQIAVYTFLYEKFKVLQIGVGPHI